MGNTVFYQEVREDLSKITWRQILSNARRKHTTSELEYGMTSGMSFNTATEEDMLKKWHKPWMFWSVLKIGWVMIAIILASYLFMIRLGFVLPAIQLLTLLIPPMVVPVTIMIFIWELNIPKNLSIVQLFGCFVIGGVLSIVLTLVFIVILSTLGLPRNWAPFAAFSEEPGKLAAAVLCIAYIQKKYGTKFYGVTAAAVGAAVGSGFGAFESAQYMFQNLNDEGIYGGITSFFKWRLVGSIGSHTVYCALGVTALLLCAKNKKLSITCLFKPLFWLAFGCAMVLHFCWNYFCIKGFFGLPEIPGQIVFLLIVWLIFLWIMKKALRQVISAGTYVSGSGVGYEPEFSGAAASADKAKAIAIIGTKGVFAGKKWSTASAVRLNFGRSSECQIQYPSDTTGISRIHCSIFEKDGAWFIVDQNSTYGTFLNNQKITAGDEIQLVNNDQIMLGGIEQIFNIVIS